MNEQLVVKNFGPIKDATVDFKRVTVFIGPTGGGKSTLAKLAAVFRDKSLIYSQQKRRNLIFKSLLTFYNIYNYRSSYTTLSWNYVFGNYKFSKSLFSLNNRLRTSLGSKLKRELEHTFPIYSPASDDTGNILDYPSFIEEFREAIPPDTSQLLDKIIGQFYSEVNYMPTERILTSAVEGAAFGLSRNKTALPQPLITFLALFEIARKENPSVFLPLLDVQYDYKGGKNLLKLKSKKVIDLSESASGVQASLPLMLVVDNLLLDSISQSFIIEEPELNLYPTAQQGLLNWLVEKCTTGENDLTITTHSPYILSHLNLLLYAHQVAEQHPDRREEVAAIVPEASWINPKEFACYQVENGGVQSLVDYDLGLIDNNELDALSGDAADAFDNLIRLSKAVAIK